MASQSLQLHFILFPLMAPGHMIPMIDIAKLLAQRGVIITIITTPVNALRFKPVIARAIESGLQIQFQEFQFPYAEAGLPEGCENVDMLPSLELTKKVLVAARMFQQPLEQLLKEMQPQPSCIISDMTLFFTVDVARKFHIPRIIFHGMCCFSLSCIHQIHVSKVFENATSESEYCVVPGLPDRVEFTKSQLSSFNANSSEGKEFLKKFMEAEKAAYGVVVNSFEELEPEYIKEYRKVRGDRVWCVGPVSLCNKDYLDKAERGNKASIDENQCFKWLDLWEPSSVIYACLGSLCNLITSQMIELGLGLEASNRPFIWVIKGDKKTKELEKWILEDGFEERTKGRGLVIQGWAPQVLILSHPSIGGFITHCGWNSTLEGICASVPMITWPLFADQFYDEKLVVELLRIGVSIGVKVTMQFGQEEKIGVLVKKEDVEKAIESLMDEGEKGKERRKRVRELGEIAKRAVDEGGSSHLNMTLLIQGINVSCNEHFKGNQPRI